MPQELRWEILQKQKNWIKTIIQELSPKLIVCAGQKTYEEFKVLYPNHEYIEGSKDSNVIRINGINLLSFKRRIGGRMKNKLGFIEYLQKYTEGFTET